eukprot:m.251709 g.251709  ORF g.251709 m.251709 type:complete len:267 (+) comp26506_c3_seq26:183-983(+)
MRTVSCRWEWARGQRMMADGGHAATPPSPNGHSGGEGKARGAEAGSAVASSGGGGGGGRGAVNSHHHPTNADSPPNPIAPTVPTVPRSPHPDYPSFPLDDLRGYPYNHMINLDYPGLQCIYRSKATAAPIFIVPNFLSEEETDICLAKCSGRLLLSRTTQGVIRTSSHVRVAREETPGLHRRLAEVTARTVENLESAKIIRSFAPPTHPLSSPLFLFLLLPLLSCHPFVSTSPHFTSRSRRCSCWHITKIIRRVAAVPTAAPTRTR